MKLKINYNSNYRKKVKGFKLKPSEDMEQAKNETILLEKLNATYLNTYIIKYLDFYHDREAKYFFVVLESFDVIIII